MTDDEAMETALRRVIAEAEADGHMTRMADLAQLLWCMVIEFEDGPERASAVRVGRKIYLEHRGRQLFPARA